MTKQILFLKGRTYWGWKHDPDCWVCGKSWDLHREVCWAHREHCPHWKPAWGTWRVLSGEANRGASPSFDTKEWPQEVRDGKRELEASNGQDSEWETMKGRQPSCWGRVAHYFTILVRSVAMKWHISGLAPREHLGGAGLVLSDTCWRHYEGVLHQHAGFQLCRSCVSVLSQFSVIQFLCQISYSPCNLCKKGLLEVLAWGASAIGRNKRSPHHSANRWTMITLLVLLKSGCEDHFLLLVYIREQLQEVTCTEKKE